MSRSENAPAKKKSSKSKKGRGQDAWAAAQDDLDDSTIMDGIPPLLMYSTRPFGSRREQYENQFNDLCELILASDATMRAHHMGGRPTLSPDFFPTLQVGYIARAMGLNLSSSQVVHLVEMVEEDEASRGSVSRSRLREVIISALQTGLLGAPALVKEGIIPVKKMTHAPSCCLRDDEKKVFEAFSVLDTAKNGYLMPEEVRVALTTMGDYMTPEEVDDMLLAMVDPESGVVQYKEFAEVLANQ